MEFRKLKKIYIKKEKRRFSGSGGLEPPKRIYQSPKKEVSEQKIMKYKNRGQKSYFNRGI
jgi:hypothetical protein